jgi:catechol 2,3-dioxygenase-like lactoylglutathione lyase family enzyme
MVPLESNFNGIQHIGIPVMDMEESKAFYVRLGFEPAMSKSFVYDGDAGRCCMMKRGHTLVELYQMPPRELEAIRRRGNGHIDHIAFAVNDIDKAYVELKCDGFTIEENAPVFIKFWKDGCKYFNLIGPCGERLEFNQIMTNGETL